MHLGMVRDRSYKIVQAFYSENPNVTIGTNDVVYTNIGDNNFYLEQNNDSIHTLDYSLAMKAVRYGWMELVKVERAE